MTRRRGTVWLALVLFTSIIGAISLRVWRQANFLQEPVLQYAAAEWQRLNQGNLIDGEARRILRANALNCGRIDLRQSATQVNDCVVRAWKSKKAFRASWLLPPIDAYVEDGLLGTADHHLYHFQFMEGPFVPDHRRINVRECANPAKLEVRSKDVPLDCADF
jgi:hypothetical protein